MAELNQFFLHASNFVWTYIIVGLCLVGGIYTSLRLAFIQFRCVPHAIALLRGKYEDVDETDGITTFQALTTALSGTTGIGVIAGVAIAIKLGGPGAIFWMWMMALLGMALKYVEATLGSFYRGDIGGKHEMGGGPMYYIVRGLGERWRPVALFYSLCAAVACIGAWNMFQANQAAANLYDAFSVPTWLTGIVLSVAAAMVLIGGIKRIGQVASLLVPTMCLIYVSTILVICIANIDKLPAVMATILTHAFKFESAGGGVLGTVVLIGVQRAIFSNEAATGSAAMAHAAAHTNYPVRQGIAASLGPFIDTLVLCAATAFVILMSGYYGNESFQNQTGAVISFEQAETTQGSHWEFLQSGIPADKHPLQRFIHGDTVLAYRAEASALAERSPAVKLSSLLDSQPGDMEGFHAIRFSAYLARAGLTAQVLDAGGKVLLQSPVVAQKRWGSWLLKPDQDLARKMVDAGEAGKYTLQFVAEGGGEAYVDRVEIVADVNGIVLSSAAFAHFFGFFGAIFLPIASLFFAYTTIIAGNYYGEVSCHFINEKWVGPYLWIYVCSTFIGCVLNLDVVINFSDLALGLMTIPNLVAMMLLTPVVVRETRAYFAALKAGQFKQ